MIGPSFGGSGENSSFSSPGQDLGCGNDGSKKHGAGDHKNKREKRKYDSGNKDKNGMGFFPILRSFS